MRIDRRTLLAGGLAAGAVLALQPAQTFAQPLWTGRAAGASRRSSLFPGVHLVHGDLHNHSHLADGMGDPTLLYTTLRAACIDAPAPFDHPCNDRGLAYTSPWWIGGGRRHERPAVATRTAARQLRSHDLSWWGHAH